MTAWPVPAPPCHPTTARTSETTTTTTTRHAYPASNAPELLVRKCSSAAKFAWRQFPVALRSRPALPTSIYPTRWPYRTGVIATTTTREREGEQWFVSSSSSLITTQLISLRTVVGKHGPLWAQPVVHPSARQPVPARVDARTHPSQRHPPDHSHPHAPTPRPQHQPRQHTTNHPIPNIISTPNLPHHTLHPRIHHPDRPQRTPVLPHQRRRLLQRRQRLLIMHRQRTIRPIRKHGPKQRSAQKPSPGALQRRLEKKTRTGERARIVSGWVQAVDTIRYNTVRYDTIRTVTHESDRCAGLACVSLSAGEQTGGKTERARDARRSPRTAADANEGGDVEEASMTVSMCLCIYACVGFQKNEARRRETARD